jgi:D-glycero-beta-D-manno-heptose-7-phosphate kinase
MTKEQFFTTLKDKNVLIIGDVMLDAYLFGKVDRISPEAPVPVVSVIRRDNRPGGAANVALNIKSLGATPWLCSVIGDDDKATQFLDIMKSLDLPVEGLIRDNSRLTTTKFRIIGNNMQMLRVDEESTNEISSGISAQLFERIAQIMNSVNIDCIVFQDYDKGVISKQLIEQTVGLAREKNIPVAVDPKRKHFHDYHHVTLFKPNLKEFLEGMPEFREPSDSIEPLLETIRMFHQKSPAKMIMITLSDKGILIYNSDDDSYFHFPAHLRKISDVSGAGDTVISVAALCLATGMNAHHIASLSNLAGGLVCQYVGVVPVNLKEFSDEINRLNLLH